MHIELLEARNNLKSQLLSNARIVTKQILNMGLENLVEVGVFGSVAKDCFTCKSDTDIYLIFYRSLPDRPMKGHLRTIAEENNCDIVFIEQSNFTAENPSLLVTEILEHRIILWREDHDDTK
jgi:predicted nucleotidyltransferase